MSRSTLLGAMLLLAACDGSPLNRLSDRERDEVSDIAGDVAYDTVSEHERVRGLQDRVEELERKLEALDSRERRMTDATISDIQSLSDAHESLRETYNKHTHGPYVYQR